MANKVDIKVQANADVSGLQKTEKELKDVAGSADKAASSASRLGDVFKGALGAQVISAVGTQFLQFAQNTIALSDHLVDLANKAGVTAEGLQVIGNAAKDNGSSLDGAANALAKLQIRGQKAIDGNKAMAVAFERLGVSIDDIKTKKPDEIFLQMADTVKNSTNRTESLNAAQATLGITAKDLFATLSLGSEGIEKLGRSFGVLSNESVKSLDEVDQKLKKVRGNITAGIGYIVGAYDDLTEGIANRLFGITDEQAKAFDEMESNAKKAAAGISAEMDEANESLIQVGGSAEAAAKKLSLIDEVFAKRSLGELSPENKLEVIRQKIEELHNSASQQFDIKFGNAADLNTIANGLGDNAMKAKELAVELASLEDAEKQARDEANKKADADSKGTDKLREKADAARDAANALRDQASGEREALEAELKSLQGQFHQTLDVRQRQADIQSRLFDIESPIVAPAKQAEGGNGVYPATIDAIGETTDAVIDGVKDATSAITDLSGALTEGFDSIASQMNDLSGSIPEKLKPIESSVISMGESITSGVESVGAAVQTKLGELMRRMAVAESQIANLR